MSNFKAKMHQIRFRLGLRPRPRWGSLQRSPRPPSWISEGLLLRGGRERKGKGREGRGRARGEGRAQPPIVKSWVRHCCTALSLDTGKQCGSAAAGPTVWRQRLPSVAYWTSSSQGSHRTAGQQYGSATTYDCNYVIWSADNGATCRCSAGLQWISTYIKSQHKDVN